MKIPLGMKMECRKRHLLAFSITTATCLFIYTYHTTVLTLSTSWKWLGLKWLVHGDAGVTEEDGMLWDSFAAQLSPVARRQWSVWNEFSLSVSKDVLQSLRYYWAINKFHVPRNVVRRNTMLGREELLCEFKSRVPLRTIRAGEGPFSGDDWEKILPTESLAERLGPLKTCAVVMSSGSIRNSTLGVEIDSHDAVLRLNGAPTNGYRIDVGNRTTIRIVNSQLMMSKGSRFLKASLYRTGVLIVWDPAPYSRDLDAWYRKPDFDFFQTYRDYRRLHPQQPFYILSPSFQWDLWDVIQENSPTDIQPNPPSSGMLGIAMTMNLCERVSVYEFLPSHRKTPLCHYFQDHYDWHCTVGHYHPQTFEKNLVKRLNWGTEFDIYARGKVTLHGFSQHTCPIKP